MRARQTGVCVLTATLVLSGLTVASAGGARAQADVDVQVEVFAGPEVVPTTGEAVRFAIQVSVPGELLPVTLVSLTSGLYGDVADPGNIELLTTSCSAPVEYAEDTPGWLGWMCAFEAEVGGAPRVLTDTISVAVRFGDGTELTSSGTVEVTISDQLGVIEGTIVDAATGEPIPGVFLQGEGSGDGFGGFTDSSGSFHFAGLEPGEYILRSGSVPFGWGRFDPPAEYRAEYAFEYHDHEPDGPIANENLESPVTVLAGQTTEIRWELSVGGAIEGMVSSRLTGEPVTDLAVLFWLTNPDGSRSPTEMGGYADVGDDGTYRLSGLRSGNYLVCFLTSLGDRCWNDVPYVAPGELGDLVAVALGETTAGIDLTIAGPTMTIPTTTPTTTIPTTGLPTSGGDGVSPVLPGTGAGRRGGFIVAMTLLAAGAMFLRLSRRSPRWGDTRPRGVTGQPGRTLNS